MTGDGPLLSVEDLRVHFAPRGGEAGRAVRAVDGVDLAIHPGETLGLVGESGCGKSTLARAIAGLVRTAAGAVRFEGADLAALSGRPLRRARRRLQMVFQDPDASLDPRMTVLAIVAEALALAGAVPRGGREARVCDLLERVGLDPAFRRRHPHEFSGGQRQRVAIARALAAGPRLILCDEPVSALDVSVQAQILNLLADLQSQLGLAYLFITHDLGVARHVSDRLAVMYLGRIVEEGPADALLARPEHPYTAELLAAVPSVDAESPWQAPRIRGDVPSPARPPSGCAFHPRCPEAFARCPREAPPLYRRDRRASRCFLSEGAGGGGGRTR